MLEKRKKKKKIYKESAEDTETRREKRGL